MSHPPASLSPPVVGRVQPRDSPLWGPVLLLVRVLWVALALAVVWLFVAGVPAELKLLTVPCPEVACTTGQLPVAGLEALGDLGLTPGFYAGFVVAMDVAFALVWVGVAVLVFWRGSDDRMVLFASLALLTFGAATFVFTLEALAAEQPSLEIPIYLLHFVGSASFGLLLFVFPDGRFVPRWAGWVAAVWLAWQLPSYLPGPLPDDPWYGWVTAAVWALALGTATYGQIRRYRRVSDPVQRQQIKWVVFGISVALVGFLGVILALAVFAPELTTPGAVAGYLIGYGLFGYLAVLSVPVTIGIAMLRHHLFDVDVVINQTLVYGALTACVVGVYVLVVGGLGAVLQGRGNAVLSLVAAALVAVLFQPLRQRLQRGVNHLMYGERDEPYEVLSRLSQRLEATIRRDLVLPTVVATVAEAMKLPYVAIELEQTGGWETVAAAGQPVSDPLRLPLVYGGEPVGRLTLGGRPGGESLTAADRRLLDDLLPQISAAAHAVRLTRDALRLSADLQRSRHRLVSAREEERRRLRRDLHDGLGPQLASLTMKAEAARGLLPTDPGRTEALLGEVMDQAQDAVADIRRLVYALRPPALDALGLEGALRSHLTRHDLGGVRVTVESPERLPPLPAAVEVAAYRIALEALTNVVRHAHAQTCVIRLTPEQPAGVLRLEIVDDGRGIGEGHGAGVGLTSMSERAAELGGSCEVEAVPSGGTLVRVHLPAANPGEAGGQEPEEA